MAWDDVKEGASLKNGWGSLKDCWNTNLPNHKQSLWNLAGRPVKG